MRRVLSILAASLACRPPVYQPPDAATTDEGLTTLVYTASSTSSSTTSLLPDLPVPPKLDIPIPDLPAPVCTARELAESCTPGCGYDLGDGIAEVCKIPAPGAPAPFYPLLVDCTAAESVDVVLADLDDDGLDDIAAVSYSESRALIWYGSSTRPLACPREHVVVSPGLLAVADFDLDGHRDLLTLSHHTTDDLSLFSLLRGRPGREFAPHELISLPAFPFEARDLLAADLDGDAAPDLLVTGWGGAQVLLGDAHGNFTPGQSFALPMYCLELRLHDLDGDTHPDLVALDRCEDPHRVVLRRNDGHGGFHDPEPLAHSDGFVQTFSIADLDGDLLPDLLFLRDTDLAVALAGPGPSYGELQTIGPSFVGQAVTALDLDNQGGLEIVVHGTDYNDFSVFGARTRILTGDLQRGFVLASYLAHNQENLPPRFGDFNGDGRPDLVFGAYISAANNGGTYFLESAP